MIRGENGERCGHHWKQRLLLSGLIGFAALNASAASLPNNNTAAPPPPEVIPLNDNFASRYLLSGKLVITNVTISPSTMEPNEPDSWIPLTNLNGVWFEWTPPAAGLTQISAGTPVHIFRGTSQQSLKPLSYPNPYAPDAFMAAVGETYQIRLLGLQPAKKHTELRIELFDLPPNDKFADRIPLTGTEVSTTGSNRVEANSEPGEVQGLGEEGRSVWWEWTAPESGVARISSEGSSFQAAIAVYTGTELEHLSRVPYPPFVPEVRFYAIKGTHYPIRIDGIERTFGTLRLNIALTRMPRSANDNFADRTRLTGANVTLHGDNLAATREPGEPDFTDSIPQGSVWYTWTAPGAGGLNFSITGEGMNPLLGIFKGDSLATLERVAGYPCNSFPPQPCGLGLITRAGETYQIVVDGGGATAGNFELTIKLTPPPPNDNFSHRQTLTGLPAQVEAITLNATLEDGEPHHSNDAYGNSGSVWFSWTAPASCPVTFDLSRSRYPVWGGFTIYTGSTLMELNRVAGSGYKTTLQAIGGVTYSIALFNSYSSLTLRILPPPDNDDFNRPILLVGTNVVSISSSDGATAQPDEPAQEPPHGNTRSTLWWQWTAPESGPAKIEALAPNMHQIMVSVYTGTALKTLHSIPLEELIYNVASFFALKGTTYRIQIEGYGGSSDDVTLYLVQPQPQDPPQSFLTLSGSGGDRLLRLKVRGEKGQKFGIETSTDLSRSRTP